METTAERIQAMKTFHKEAAADLKEIAAARKEGVGLLTPSLLKKHIASGQDLVLAYGRKGAGTTFQIAGRTIVAKDGYITLTLPDLKALADAQNRAQGAFQQPVKGVPLLLLEKMSDPGDRARSKEVRNATLYRFDKNVLFFRVSGNSKPSYQVKIRLEEWNSAVTSSTANYLMAARAVATGKISIECPCGRHQYWYRYLATIGGFAIAPEERDFPKIRNPGLKGCCCKHVLKVLRVLRSSTIHALLAKEMERQSSRVTGFASGARGKELSREDLAKASRVRGVSRSPQEAWDSMRQFTKQAAQALRDAARNNAARDMQAKPRPGGKAQVGGTRPATGGVDRRTVVSRLGDMMTAVNLNLPGYTLEGGLKGLSKSFGLSASDLKAIMKEEGIA